MNILGLDTSTKTLAVAVVKNGTAAAMYNYGRQMRHSRNLVRCLDRVLRAARVDMARIDRIACGVGPGSYTGLRIGHAFVRGLTAGREIPVIPFSSLELIAYNMKPKHTTIAVVINARREKFYCGVFTRENAQLRRRGPDSVLSLDEVKALLRNEAGIAVTGDALEKHAADLLPYVASQAHLYRARFWYARAENMAALIGAQSEEAVTTADRLMPNYLRISEAEEKFGRVM